MRIRAQKISLFALDPAQIFEQVVIERPGTALGWPARRDPRRFLRVRLRFEVSGDVPVEKIDRALALSRETYCSVWHSLRPDIEFETSFERVDG